VFGLNAAPLTKIGSEAHFAEARAAYLATVPAGRMGTADDIPHAVSFFASEAAGFIISQRLVVDSGRHLGA
jgi:3-oxoacyl-[acyl-carrier protein] reductase